MRRTLFATITTAVFATSLVAGEIEPVTLDPITHQDAELLVVAPDGSEVRYTPSDLEGLTTYRMRTTTPWRNEAADFEGVLLVDVLAASGLDVVDSIVVTAENDYTTTFDRDVWESVSVMIATRVDGQPHTRRMRGPIQFVISADEFEETGRVVESHFVWMAARIAAE